MKKRLFSAGLAAVLALSCGTTVLAEIIQQDGGTESKEVYATYISAEAPTVYAVEIKWGKMEFTYHASTMKKTWDPLTHTYTENTEETNGEWTNEESENEINLTNRSNAALTATVDAVINDSYNSISAIANPSFLSLGNAAMGATTTVAGTATTGKTSISLSGELSDKDASGVTIGSVTVTIKDAEGEQP